MSRRSIDWLAGLGLLVIAGSWISTAFKTLSHTQQALNWLKVVPPTVWHILGLVFFISIVALNNMSSIRWVGLYAERWKRPLGWLWANQHQPVSFNRRSAEPVLAYCFAIKGKNNSRSTIKPKRAYIQGPEGTEIDLNYSDHAPLTSRKIPAHTEFDLIGLIPETVPGYANGMFATTFADRFYNFAFIFEYEGGARVTRHFSHDEVLDFIGRGEELNSTSYRMADGRRQKVYGVKRKPWRKVP